MSAGHQPTTYHHGPYTIGEIRALGATTDLITAGRILGLGRAQCYRLAQKDAFPVPVIHAGRRWRVPVAPLVRLLETGTTAATPPELAVATRDGLDAPGRVERH